MFQSQTPTQPQIFCHILTETNDQREKKPGSPNYIAIFMCISTSRGIIIHHNIHVTYVAEGILVWRAI